MQAWTIIETDVTNRYEVIYVRDVNVDDDVIIRGQYPVKTYATEAVSRRQRAGDGGWPSG